mmetsp:Transcript_54991/g.112343  ORF Transcript_54991/g.112343 Transcript_54991/m.112343 type:complete len:242 (-) Transcript_54991:176-901(-)
MLASSSSSSTSIRLCSSVLPTSTWSMGSTSKSKSKRSPSLICVSRSTPVLRGRNSGEGGLSMNASVCVSTSSSAGRSEISSRKLSVCTSMCFRPPTASGVFGRATCRVRWRFFISASFRFSASFCNDTGSGTAVAGSTCAAYVFPRTTLLSHIIFTARRSSISAGSRNFFRLETARGCCANAYPPCSVDAILKVCASFAQRPHRCVWGTMMLSPGKAPRPQSVLRPDSHQNRASNQQAADA